MSMDTKKLLIPISVAMFALLAIVAIVTHEPPNRDPRHGPVVLSEENCFSDCYTYYKICVGPDLRFVYEDGNSTEHDFTHTDRNSVECRR